MRGSRFRVVALAAALVLGTAHRAGAQDVPPPEPQPLLVAASAALGGDFAHLGCTPGTAPGLVSLASQLAGEPEALAFDAGGFLGAAALSRLTVDRDANALADATSAMHLRAFALDQDDLAMPRGTLVRAARAFAAHGTPALLGNLRCAPSAAALCSAVLDESDVPLLLETPAGRVAIVSAVTPTALSAIARDRADGITLLDPALALGVAVRTAREAGARWVIAAYDPQIGHELEDALAVAHRIAPRASPDLLFVRRIETQLRAATIPEHRSTLVATHDASVVLVDARLPAEPRPTRTGAVPDDVTRFVDRTHAWLCSEFREPRPGGTLDAPLELPGFANLLLDVLRDRTHTEIAVINRGAIDSHAPFPIRGAITALDVIAALPYDNQIRVTRLSSTALQTFVQSNGFRRFFVRGATVENGQVRVNGRPLDDGVRYSIVTTDYVADGGDGGIGADLTYVPAGTETVRDVFLAWLGVPHELPVLRAPLDPAQRTLWLFRATLDGSFSSVIVDNPNPAVFTDASLSRTPSTTARVDLEMHADAFHPEYRWENTVRLLYGATMSTPAGMPVNLIETADLITARTTAVSRGLLGPRRVWYRPRPYVDNYIESEFNRPATRNYQHLEIRPTAGLRFEASDRLSFNVGAGLSWEVFATPLDLTPPGSPAAPIFSLGFNLRPGHVFPIGTRFADGEITFDAGLRDPFGQLSAQLRAHARIIIPLFDPIALTLSYDVYTRYARYFDDQGFVRGDWAISTDVSLGLRVSFARALQAFAF